MGGPLGRKWAVLPDFKRFDNNVAWYMERLDVPCYPGARLTLRQQIYVKLQEKASGLVLHPVALLALISNIV